MDLPIVDTHVHLWDTHLLRYPWLDDVPSLNRPFLPADYRIGCGPVEVEKVVLVQAQVESAQFMKEAEWVSLLAREQCIRIAGLVPWAPLEEGERARPALEVLAGDPLVKGIRRIIQNEPDPEFCLRPDFVRGVQALSDYGLHFELCIDQPQMAAAIRLVEKCPTVRFILDHIGKPHIAERALQPWSGELRVLAGFPNVWCKMSGLVTEADHAHWTRDDLRPYIEHVLECFGFERVMFGSDWPVVTLAATYPAWVETLEWALSGCAQEDVSRLFRENAIGFYRLE